MGEESGAGFGVMANVDAFHEKQNILGDIGGVVRNAFEVPSHKDQVQGGGNPLRVLFHEANHFVVDSVSQIVHGVIGDQHASSQVRILLHKGIQRFPDHGFHQIRHVRDIHQCVHRRLVHQVERSFGNADRQVSHSFEIVIDFDGGRNEAQIGGHRLFKSQQAHSHIINLDFHLVHTRLIFKDL